MSEAASNHVLDILEKIRTDNKLSSLEVVANHRSHGSPLDMTVIGTTPNKEIRFLEVESLLSSLIQQALMDYKNLSQNPSANITLRAVTRSGGPPIYEISSEHSRQEQKTQNENHQRRSKKSDQLYTISFVNQICDAIEANTHVLVVFNPRDHDTCGFWKDEKSHYYYGEALCQGPPVYQPKEQFTNRKKFSEWLSKQSDLSFFNGGHDALNKANLESALRMIHQKKS